LANRKIERGTKPARISSDFSARNNAPNVCCHFRGMFLSVAPCMQP
jgi:hypothetical protein